MTNLLDLIARYIETILANAMGQLFNFTENNTRYAYVRVSTEGQDAGIQYKAINQYTGGLPRDCFFRDKATGRNFNRRGYRRLKKKVKPGDEVIIYDVSRLGRNMPVMLLEYLWFLFHGVRLRVLSESSTLTEPREGDERKYLRDNLMFFAIRANQAEADLDVREQRTTDGVKQKKKQGGYNGLNHRGVDRTPIDPDLFQQQYELYMAGQTTYRKCAELFPIGYSQIRDRMKEKQDFETYGLPIKYDPNTKYCVQVENAKRLFPDAFRKEAS